MSPENQKIWDSPETQKFLRELLEDFSRIRKKFDEWDKEVSQIKEENINEQKSK
jgi:hypothetical protein